MSPEEYAAASEAEIKRLLLTPLLESVAHCASSMVLPDSTAALSNEKEYATSFAVEVNTEKRPHQQGRKPHVDYFISGICDDDILYAIPVEAKKHITVTQMPQLAHYVSTMGSRKPRQPCSSTGMLIDGMQVCIAFSVFATMLQDENIFLSL